MEAQIPGADYVNFNVSGQAQVPGSDQVEQTQAECPPDVLIFGAAM